MTAVYTNQLSAKGRIQLSFVDELGQATDMQEVRWTAYSADGRPASGKSLLALRAGAGLYEAGWMPRVAPGGYTIVWEYRASPNESFTELRHPVFVADPSDLQYSGGQTSRAATPPPGSFCFLAGQVLGRGDLPLFLSNSCGIPQDAFAVYWQIFDAANAPASLRTSAAHPATGEYYAAWTASAVSGDYVVVWDFQPSAAAPLESISMQFTVINPAAPADLSGV